MRFSLGSEISSRKPLCDGLSMNALDFGAHHSGDAQPPDQARADCVSGETEHKLGNKMKVVTGMEERVAVS